MGRLRIKKKSDDYTPLAKTLPYRLLLVLATGAAFFVCAFGLLAAYRADGFSPTALMWTAAAGIAAAAALYNIERLKEAQVPAATMKRMKRR